MKTIDQVFKNVFGKALISLGFINPKQSNILFKLVNGEVLQFVSIKKESARVEGRKEFTIIAGVRSIYAESIEKKALLYCACDLLYLAGDSYSMEQRRQLVSISYDEATMEEAVDFALLKTLEIILPKLNMVTDLSSCIEFYKKYRPDMLDCADCFHNDSLILIKTDNRDTFAKEIEEQLGVFLARLEKGEIGGDINSYRAGLHHGFITAIAEPRDKVFSDPELYARATTELERRKDVSKKILESYGLL